MTDKNAYLKAMGIDVWLEREPAQLEVINNQVAAAPLETKVEVSQANITPPDNAVNQQAETIESKTAITDLNWPALRSMVAECSDCELSKSRKQTVFGQGDQNASLMIIADMPTEQDENQGAAFTGEVGALLTAMLKAMGYQRNEVYITNIVKCRTTQNQEPSEQQASSCESYLLRQINLVQPKLILAFGSFAAQRLLKTKSTMTRLRGQLHYTDDISAPVLVTYHPAYLLQATNEKRKAWEDLQLVMKELGLGGASG